MAWPNAIKWNCEIGIVPLFRFPGTWIIDFGTSLNLAAFRFLFVGFRPDFGCR